MLLGEYIHNCKLLHTGKGLEINGQDMAKVFYKADKFMELVLTF